MTCDFIEYDPCAAPSNLVAAFKSRLAHSYTDGVNINAVLDALLAQVVEFEASACTLLDNFDCDTAVGDQLDLIGLLIGLPRTVCGVYRGIPQVCGAAVVPLEDYTFADDDEYRKYIKALIASQNFDGTLAGYTSILQFLFDDVPLGDPLTGEAKVLVSHAGYVLIGIPRALTAAENQLMELVKFILSYYGATDVRVAFGVDYFTMGDNAALGVCQPFAEII